MNEFVKTALDSVCVNHTVFTIERVAELNGIMQNTLIAEEDLSPENPKMKEFIGAKLPDAKVDLLRYLLQCAALRIHKKREVVGDQRMKELERIIFLKTIDQFWMTHIDSMTLLKDGIGLQAYGQHDPVVEYKRTAHEMYEHMIQNIRLNTVFNIGKAKVQIPGKEDRVA